MTTTGCNSGGVGSIVGELGWLVGCPDGDIDGCPEGCPLGIPEGCVVGCVEGFDVGCPVGIDGVDVG